MTGSGSQTWWDPWTYRRDAGVSAHRADLAGFAVEATDGSIGTVQRATYEVGSSYVLVDTGPWVSGGRLLLPAGIVSRVDRLVRTVYVDRTKDEIKGAPAFDEDTRSDTEYRARLGDYYGRYRY
ncbi:MAG TPA: PRC-barrel domain containing protein [Actinoplanes sp.]|nr:PRC-barrel domain containing protein [Actinoplanes sp.]